MARLILSLDNQVLAEYNMTKERYTVGRLPDNDVRIDNPAVSGHHSLIINILNDSFLEDLNSTNGTYVNGKLIKKHALQHGDVITIGHHQLRFADQQVNAPEQDEFEKTMVIPTGQQSAAQLARAEAAADRAAAAAKQARQPQREPDAGVRLDPEEAAALDERPVKKPAVAAKPEPRSHTETAAGIDPRNAPSALPLAKLQVLSGAFAGRELELTKALTTLGRPGVQVAAITRRAEGYYIVHVESGKEGDYPLVNGQPIGAQARRLNDNDVVQLAGVKMGFFKS
ncbi:MAG: FHA domain-containing protein [Gammaproteobacteria bacterium]|nr:FHA domain-containing protein [Gammaproteobacteria bacterium]MDH5321166.1 FHA domain-containing protein [Gammaproteobacteria bacterium]